MGYSCYDFVLQEDIYRRIGANLVGDIKLQAWRNSGVGCHRSSDQYLLTTRPASYYRLTKLGEK